MCRALLITASERLWQRGLLALLEWLCRRDAMVFFLSLIPPSFSFCTNFSYQWVIHFTPPPLFHFPSHLSMISHPPFWWQSLLLPLLFCVSHAPTHFPGAPAHSFTWFKYVNTHTRRPLQCCGSQAQGRTFKRVNALFPASDPLLH